MKFIINSLTWIYVTCIIILLLSAYYVKIAYEYLPLKIPFLYTLPWGNLQLANKSSMWILLGLSALIIITNAALSFYENSKSNFYISRFYSFVTLLCTIVINSYAVRIVYISSTKEILFPIWIKLLLIPMVLAFLSTVIITPLVIKFAKKYNFMDDPFRHKHPGMLLKKPVPRAGGFAFLLGILIPGIFLLPIITSQKIIGIIIGSIICVVVGLVDDKKDVSPYKRLLIQALSISIAVLSGIILIYISNPFGEAIKLDSYKYVINFAGEHKIYYFGALAAALWIGWTMNFMSWANGTDGVYAGLVTISAFVISILMLQTLDEDPGVGIFIKLAALTSGAGLGMAIFTWPPQKLLWGFGATSAGLIIAALSILGSTKVATTLIVLMIPFLDGLFAIVRRLRRKQLPFWGDREHLHHKLLEGLGWSKQKVAVFYWSTTILLGAIGILTSGQIRALSLATIATLIIAGIASINFIKKPKQ
ncbi:hypothetical protein CO058_03460 [candidate division WWE3 bacterium CG_4_9_14_0_2_um_filter_35_11]|uniref:Undecaprenyl/decaprenyl-phosphate alpha-N-acetylglucosaminyl 1-phosphate transferase n=1 Tax=candidate division WWE3 bacterium CG_4_9_14_0_2_um_filter_35_11 TaxID=1975077 RepID=A0A2M8EL45_UNCKA|nr:MAG: hypothetical protein COV25_00855 [candidate division WWE3 bacterium CG10_big_fil_rev_8_21_14_0_10_35_32]PJC23464.1 MAG: hypothetical protein CO058_03460 [candidate division WWE3 bacterium CG_4_9_14_0_2_um_filter_35_11]